MSSLDEFKLTGHDENWKSDFDCLKEMGVSSVRYGVNWPSIHTRPNQIDWRNLDERLNYACNTLGLTVIADLVHYGTPTWLSGSFADPEYPDTIAYFAGEFAKRFRGTVNHITPLNEPLTTASFCGLRGIWPPALSGWDGWTKVAISISLGISRSIAAIREANSDAVIVHIEATSLYDSKDSDLLPEVSHLESIGLLPTDLILGKVDENHLLFKWLVANGASREDLKELIKKPPVIDLLGLNYYPNLTPRFLQKNDGHLEQVAVNLGADGLAKCIRKFADRYELPMMIGETSIEGSDSEKINWLNDSIALINEMRASGIDIRGYTWWPLFDFVDWSYSSRGNNLEEFLVDEEVLASRASAIVESAKLTNATVRVTPFLRRMGLIRLEEQSDGSLKRVVTSAAVRFQEIIQKGLCASGSQQRIPNYVQYFADPFILDSADGYVAFGTSIIEGQTGSAIKAIKSKNLVDWEELGTVILKVPENLGSDFWAPEVVFSENYYWIYFSVGHGDKGHHIRVGKSQSPHGPFLDQGVNLTPNERFAIDAHPFKDEDGTWYLYFARDVLESKRVGTHLAASKLLNMTKLDSVTTEILVPDANWQIYEFGRQIYDQIVDWYTLEGPSVVKRFGKYYLFFSGGNWQNESYGVSYAISDTPLGPWVHISAENALILNTKMTGLVGPGHSSIINLGPSMDAIVYHAWDRQQAKRQIYIDKLSWRGEKPEAINIGLFNSENVKIE